ncbi:hypothetical protein DdX_04241 [Ditylenchus destructor]|uniref:Uncharacterized protein n=1 Tax=Ditylenchus destructor TaxID=166010 RepID=A0AAD4NB64_9BILA|nr:hypothetical protein DdX_04241 [Ditylenchus destructor]
MNTTEILHITSASLPYLLVVPSDAEKHGEWPVLCFLHGNDEAAPCPIREGVTRHGPLNPNNPDRVQSEFIIVAPQLPEPGDKWFRYSNVVKDITTSVQREHGGDPNRTYLTGFSYGANGVFDLGIEQSDFWAALWPVDPTRVPKEELNQPIWISIGAAARRLTASYIQQVNVKPLNDGLDGDRYYLDEGEDHVGSARKAYKDERIYDWLLAKRFQ